MAAEMEPTVKPFPGFNASADAKALRAAMKGLGTNETAIIDIVTKRSSPQKRIIIRSFKLEFGRDLMADLESELRGKLEKLILSLMEPPVMYQAKELHAAMQGFGTDADVIAEILCTHTSPVIKEICEIYEKLFGASLQSAIETNVASECKGLLVLLITNERDAEAVCPDKAKEEAEKLQATAGKGKWASGDEVFINLLAEHSLGQLALIFQEYEESSSKKVVDTVEAEFSGKLKTVVLTIVKCAMGVSQYFADKLESAFKGLGTDDSTLIRILVTRCEIDLRTVRKAYEKTYGRTLADAISSEASGDYKKALLALI